VSGKNQEQPGKKMRTGGPKLGPKARSFDTEHGIPRIFERTPYVSPGVMGGGGGLSTFRLLLTP
jgi:hypothetical protein